MAIPCPSLERILWTLSPPARFHLAKSLLKKQLPLPQKQKLPYPQKQQLPLPQKQQPTLPDKDLHIVKMQEENNKLHQKVASLVYTNNLQHLERQLGLSPIKTNTTAWSSQDDRDTLASFDHLDSQLSVDSNRYTTPYLTNHNIPHDADHDVDTAVATSSKTDVLATAQLKKERQQTLPQKQKLPPPQKQQLPLHQKQTLPSPQKQKLQPPQKPELLPLLYDVLLHRGEGDRGAQHHLCPFWDVLLHRGEGEHRRGRISWGT